MFQFTWFASYSYELAIGYLTVGFPIRISTGQWIFAPLRSFSQLVTSFVASWCLGIHLVLFLTWPLLINISVYFQFNCLFKKFWLVFKLLWFKNLAWAKLWWTWVDSNHRPHAYQACALTTWATGPYGGDEESRTPDLLLARQALSQLSYTPMY